MSTEAMKQAQAAIKSALDFYSVMFGIPVDSMLVTHHSEAKALFEKCMAAMESLSQALEQPAPAQEPDPDELTIAYLNGIDTGKKRKPWVGLTNEERHACTQSPFTADNYLAIEAKLKEKNG